MKHYFDTFPTPMGDFTVVVDSQGAVIATTFGGAPELGKRLKTDGLLLKPDVTAQARRELEEFFSGRLRRFTLKLAPSGTAFQRRVWSELKRIPYGETLSYGEVAQRIGCPGAARAVGRANGGNPICVIVPCHRVIGADGSLTGFGFGTELKRRLLELEARQKSL